MKTIQETIKGKIKRLEERERKYLVNKLNNLDWRLVNLKEYLIDNENYFKIWVYKKDPTWSVSFIVNETIYSSIYKNLTPYQFINSSIYNGPETANEFYKLILSNYTENEDFFVLSNKDWLEKE